MSVVDNAIYIDGNRAVVPDSLDQTFEALHSCPSGGQNFAWIGMLRPDEEEIRAVAKEFSLHSLAVEDTVNAHQRPKLEQYGDVLFVVLRPARYVDKIEEVEIGEVHLFLGPDFVITVRHAAEPDLGVVRTRLEADPQLLRQGPNAVLYAVLDKVVDDYGPVMEGLQTDIDQIEVQVFDGDPHVSRRIYQLSREVIDFQRAVDPLADLLDALRATLKQRAEGTDLGCGATCATSPTTSRRPASPPTTSASCSATSCRSTPRSSGSARTRRCAGSPRPAWRRARRSRRSPPGRRSCSPRRSSGRSTA